jgi:recombinational DNA repair protein (RecF pathway)
MWGSYEEYGKAGMMQECDMCHYDFPLRAIKCMGKQFLCEKCRSQEEAKEEAKKKTQVIRPLAQ